MEKLEEQIKKYAKNKKLVLTRDHWEMLFIIIKYSQQKKNNIFKKSIVNFSVKKYIYILFPKGLMQLYKILKIDRKDMCI